MEDIKMSDKLLLEDKDTIGNLRKMNYIASCFNLLQLFINIVILIGEYMTENNITNDLQTRIRNYINFIHFQENPIKRE